MSDCDCRDPDCCATPNRRQFLAMVGMGAAAAMAAGAPAAGAPVRATHRAEDGRVTITLSAETVVSAGQSLEITFR